MSKDERIQIPYLTVALIALQGLRRVHIGSFVLVYEVFENPTTVRVLKYKHHDEAYQ